MRKKSVALIIIAAVFGVGAVACTYPDVYLPDFSTSETAEESGKEDLNSALSENDAIILSLLQKIDEEGLSEEEYSNLANRCEEAGYIKVERDLLEDEYRLFGSEEAFNRLQELAVNVDEEDEGISALITELSNETEEMSDESVLAALQKIEDESTLSILMPKLFEGIRTYFVENDGNVIFVFKVGYINNEPFYSLINILDGGKHEIIRNGGNVVIYNEDADAFTKTTIDLNGEVKIEQGTVKDGVVVGTYTSKVSKFDSYKLTLSGIFTKKDDYLSTVFAGEFDEKGQTILTQPSEETRQAFALGKGTETVIIYAYNEDKTQCLYEGISNEEANNGFSFGNSFLKIEEEISITLYEPKEAEWLSAYLDKKAPVDTQIAVKVVDGQVIVFDGKSWNDYGKVEDMVEGDPYHSYDTKKDESMEQASKLVSSRTPVTEFGAITEKIDDNTQSVASTPAPTVATTNNNTTTSQTPKATPTPKPTATPTKAPASSNQSSGNSGGSQSQPSTPQPTAAPTAPPTAAPTATPTAVPTAAPTPAPTAAPTAPPTPEPTTPPPSGNDGGDMEYSPDME